jgi:hypothetical protein
MSPRDDLEDTAIYAPGRHKPRFDARITLGNIIQIITFLGALVAGYMSMNTKIDELGHNANLQSAITAAHNELLSARLATIEQRLVGHDHIGEEVQKLREQLIAAHVIQP